MAKRKYYIFLSLVCVCLALLLINLPQSTNIYPSARINIETPENIILKPSSNGQIITINSNYELNQTASAGNGTLANPYIIRDKKIDADGNKFGILINNTNKFFSLINCTVFNASYGLFLHNLSKGNVYDCYFRDNSITGIMLINCSNNFINYNYIYSNLQRGIVFNCSNNNEISGNYLWDNQHSGIYLNCSNYNNITSNLLTNHDNAIYLQSSNHSYIAYNFGSFNNHTIVQINCVDNTLVKNFIDWFDRANTEIEQSDDEQSELIRLDFTYIIVFGLLICMMASVVNKISVWLSKKRLVHNS